MREGKERWRREITAGRHVKKRHQVIGEGGTAGRKVSIRHQMTLDGGNEEVTGNFKTR